MQFLALDLKQLAAHRGAGGQVAAGVVGRVPGALAGRDLVDENRFELAELGRPMVARADLAVTPQRRRAALVSSEKGAALAIENRETIKRAL